MPKHFYNSTDYGDFSAWDSVTTERIIRPYFRVTVNLDGGTVSRHTYDAIFAGGEGDSFDIGDIIDLSFPRENILRDRSSFTITWDANSSIALGLIQAKHAYAEDLEAPTARIRLYLLDDTETAIIDGLTVAFGFMDQAVLEQSAERRVVTTQFWNGPDYMWDTPKPGRYTADFQKQLFSINESPFDDSFASDKGFDFVAALQDWSFFWGKGKSGGSKANSKAKGKNKERRG